MLACCCRVKALRDVGPLRAAHCRGEPGPCFSARGCPAKVTDRNGLEGFEANDEVLVEMNV